MGMTVRWVGDEITNWLEEPGNREWIPAARAFVATASPHHGNSTAAACQDRLKTSLPGNDSDTCLGDYRAAGIGNRHCRQRKGPPPRRSSLRRYMMFCLSEFTVAA